MAEEKYLSPEKQLLKLIEEQKPKDALAKDTLTIQAQAIKRQGLSFLSLGAWLGRGSFLKANASQGIKNIASFQWDIKAINKALGLCVLGLSILFITNSSYRLIRLNDIPKFEFNPVPGAGLSGSDGEPLLTDSLSYYLDKARQRDIFKMGKTVSEETKKAKSITPISELTQHLKLVGISWSNDPDAMIEDANAFRTFFVKRGQMIGEIKVEAIFKDKVVLSYDGEEAELK